MVEVWKTLGKKPPWKNLQDAARRLQDALLDVEIPVKKPARRKIGVRTTYMPISDN